MSKVLNGKWQYKNNLLNGLVYTSKVKNIDSSLIKQPDPLTQEELARYKLNKYKKKRKFKRQHIESNRK
jgi:hypothetical protein